MATSPRESGFGRQSSMREPRASQLFRRRMTVAGVRRPTLADQSEALLEFQRKFSAYGPLSRADVLIEDVATVGHIGSTVEEVKDPDYFRRWMSLSIAFLVTFLLAIQNTIYWNSLFPFLSEIDPSAGESFFGICIMIFNLGSTLASPLFGYWSNRIQQCRLPIIVGIAMTIVGNLLLMFVEAFPYNRKWVLFGARFLAGIGVGNYGSLYAYVVMGSTLKERNKALSIRAAINSAAIMTGPALQTAFVPIGYPGYVWGPLHINTYTAPAITNIILGVAQIIIMLTLFREYWVGVSELADDSVDPEGNKPALKPYDKVAAGVCIWTRFAQMFCLAYDNTIGSPLTMVMFMWNASEAVLYNGVILIVSAVCDFVGNLFMGNYVLRFVQERKAILIGVFIFIGFFIISFPWPGQPPMIPAADNTGALISTAYTNATTTPSNSSTYSCDYSWCSYTSRINLPQYVAAYACLVLSVSIAFTPNATLFSKVLGPRKQGTLQGLFAAAGQLSMTIAPLVVSTVFDYGGPRVTNVIGGAVLVVTIIANVIFYKRLVPWTDEDEQEDKDAPFGQRGDDETQPLLTNKFGNKDKLHDYYSLPQDIPEKEEAEE